MSSGRSASVVSKALVENDLIEEFHWLPQDIEKIPYKSLQMFYLIRKAKVQARQAKVELDGIRQKQTTKTGTTSGRGQVRR